MDKIASKIWEDMEMSIVKFSVLAVLLMAVSSAASSFAAEPVKPDAGKKDPKDMKADEANDAGLCPICKGEFKPVYHFEYKNKEYHFRTRKCCEEFKADPTKFGAIGDAWKTPAPPVEEKKETKKPAPK